MIFASHNRSVGFAITLLTAVVFAGLTSGMQATELPTDLRDAVQRTASAWASMRYRDAAALARTTASDLGKWILTIAPAVSAAEILAMLKKNNVPVVANEERIDWNSRREMIDSPRTPLVVAYASWSQDDRRLTILIIRYVVVRGEGSRPYMRSMEPIIVTEDTTRKWGAIAPRSVRNGDEELSVGVLAILGFQSGDWPDILLGLGPEGTGLGVLFAQLHAKSDASEWNLVWKYEGARIVDYTVQSDMRLIVRFHAGTWDRRIVVEEYQLKPGRAATVVRISE